MQLMNNLRKDYIELDTSSDDEGRPCHTICGGSASKHALSAGTAAGVPVPIDYDEPTCTRTREELDAFFSEYLSLSSRPASPIPELRIIVAHEEEFESETPEDVRESIAEARRPNMTQSPAPSDADLVQDAA